MGIPTYGRPNGNKMTQLNNSNTMTKAPKHRHIEKWKLVQSTKEITDKTQYAVLIQTEGTKLPVLIHEMDIEEMYKQLQTTKSKSHD
jgi:hypothetical protein